MLNKKCLFKSEYFFKKLEYQPKKINSKTKFLKTIKNSKNDLQSIVKKDTLSLKNLKRNKAK